MKKSKVLLGGGIGLLVGAGAGALIGSALHEPNTWLGPASEWAKYGALAGSVIGLCAGILAGGMVGIDKTIQIEGKSDSEIKKTLEDLRKKARVPNFQ